MPTPLLLLTTRVPDDVRDALLVHLEGLFSLAQVVTMNAEEAVRLVEATYEAAFERSADAGLPEDPKTWLYALMLELHTARSQPPTALPEAEAGEPGEAPAPPPAVAKPADDFRRRLAEQFVHQALPAAFATLPPDQRLLLMLCNVQALSCDAAGRIIGLPEDEACRRLDAARLELHEALYDNATEVERHLLATSLGPDWDRAALVHLAQTELVPLPPTLRPAVERPAGLPDRPTLPVPPVTPDAAAPGAAASGGVEAGAEVPWSRVATRLTAMLLIIMVAGLMGYAFSGLLRAEPETNLLTLSVERRDASEIAFRTGDAAEAERHVRSELGWRLVLPGIDGAALVGVDVREITDGVEVPVFVYEDLATSQLVTLYAYTYALLDRYPNRIRLERDILHQIEEDGNYDLYDLGEVRVLVWRNRDDIFVAVMSPSVSDLRERIAFPS